MRLRTQTVAESMEEPNATTYFWDYLDLKEVTEPDGRDTTFIRDHFGRITSYTVEDSDGTTLGYEYNWRGQVTQRTLTANVNVENYTYDKRGLLTQIDYTNPTASARMDYDICGRQTRLTFGGGLERRYGYDRIGRMIWDVVTDTDFNKFETYFSFDKAGNRVSQVWDRKVPISSYLASLMPDDGGESRHCYGGTELLRMALPTM